MKSNINKPAPSPVASLWTLIASAVVIGVAGSLLLHRLMSAALPLRPLPIYSTIKGDVTATERSGSVVRMSSLRGKVIACAYLYTVCPHGCAAVVTQMQKLHHDFGAREDFHQVSIAVVPDRDTPATLDAYAKAIGVQPGDHWWFLTGQRDPLVNFVTNDLKLEPCRIIPVAERLNPADVFEHDLRIVLIDRKGQVRGYYDVFHPQPEIAELMCERLHRDTRMVLDESEP